MDKPNIPCVFAVYVAVIVIIDNAIESPGCSGVAQKQAMQSVYTISSVCFCSSIIILACFILHNYTPILRCYCHAMQFGTGICGIGVFLYRVKAKVSFGAKNAVVAVRQTSVIDNVTICCLNEYSNYR